MGEMIQPAEEAEIFSSGQARKKAQVGTCMVAKISPDRRRFASGIEPGDPGGAARREEQSREYAQQCGLAGTIRAQQSYRFARFDLKGDATKSRKAGAGKG